MKNLKMVYNDIFGKNIEKYWKSEGNNKRMRCYYSIAKFLDKLKIVLSILVLLYMICLAFNTIRSLLMGFNSCVGLNCIFNDSKMIEYDIFHTCYTFLMLSVLCVFICSFNHNITKRMDINMVIIFIILLPTVYLIVFGFKYQINNIIVYFSTLFICICSILIIHVINNRIFYLYEIATGKKSRKLNNGKGE